MGGLQLPELLGMPQGRGVTVGTGGDGKVTPDLRCRGRGDRSVRDKLIFSFLLKEGAPAAPNLMGSRFSDGLATV